MSQDADTPSPPGNQFLVYQTADGKLKIDVRFEGETVWLTQQHMAKLFQTTKQNVGQHLKSIFAEGGRLVHDSVVKESFTTAADGKNYATRFYNLDAIISGWIPGEKCARHPLPYLGDPTFARIHRERVRARR